MHEKILLIHFLLFFIFFSPFSFALIGVYLSPNPHVAALTLISLEAERRHPAGSELLQANHPTKGPGLPNEMVVLWCAKCSLVDVTVFLTYPYPSFRVSIQQCHVNLTAHCPSL